VCIAGVVAVEVNVGAAEMADRQLVVCFIGFRTAAEEEEGEVLDTNVDMDDL
jgi:hypothetical protein